jgi:hypothetical protein
VRGAGRRRPWSADRSVLEAPDGGGAGAAKQEQVARSASSAAAALMGWAHLPGVHGSGLTV